MGPTNTKEEVTSNKIEIKSLPLKKKNNRITNKQLFIIKDQYLRKQTNPYKNVRICHEL